MAPVETNTLWGQITDLDLQVVLDQARGLVQVLALVCLLWALVLKTAALLVRVAQPPSTRTSFISSEPRSWRIRCWPGANLCRIISKWLFRERGLCRGCSSSSPWPAWSLELVGGQEVVRPDRDQGLGRWAQAIAELMVSTHGRCRFLIYLGHQWFSKFLGSDPQNSISTDLQPQL